MSESMRSHLVHALLSFLMAVGLLLPLLGILDPALPSPVLIPWIALVIALFELSSFRKSVRFAAAGAALVLLLLWLFAMGGMLIVSDAVMAIVLRCNNIRTAIPLVASSVTALLTILITLVSCLICLRGASFLPSSVLCFSMILLIYLTGTREMIPWFLPALVSLLLILLTERFPETSLPQLIPLAVLIVAAAFFLAGGGVGQNPLRRKADELRQAVLDRLFFTEPRDIFSLSSENYYPEGQDQLGGKPNPTNHPVMMVSTPRTAYLRGVILNEYTGRGWINTTDRRRYLRQSSRLSDLRASLFDEELPSLNIRNALCDPVTISVRMLSDAEESASAQFSSTLFVPQRVRSLIPGGDLVPYFNNSSELFVTRNLQAGDTYTVTAPLFLAGDSGLGTLIEVCSTMEDNAYEKIVQTYTTLPSHLEGMIYSLASEAASAAVSPYDKALALRSWLSRSFRYTLDVQPQSPDMDFVTSFLLDTKEGYCTYFASAMTILCRMVGLPARYVEGYVAEPDANGQALVTGLSAHAWTEVYFKGFGWLTFDATPRHSGDSGQNHSDGSSSPDSAPSPSPQPPESGPQEDNNPTPEPENPDNSENTSDSPSPSPDPAASSEPPDSAGSSSGSFPLLLLILLLLLAALVLRFRLTDPAVRERHADNEAQRFDIWSEEIAELLYAENLSRRSGETPMAFGRRIDRSSHFNVSLNPVGECISWIRYSPNEAGETETGVLRDTAVLLKSDLSRPARLRYYLRRIFIKKRTQF